MLKLSHKSDIPFSFLGNGALLLLVKMRRGSGTVLAKWKEGEYATWEFNNRGDCYSGCYFTELREALDNFEERARITKELKEFENCLKKLGIPYCKESRKDDPSRSKTQVSISQAIFHFNERDEFIAVEDDEIGGWQPRK